MRVLFTAGKTGIIGAAEKAYYTILRRYVV